MTTEGSVRTMSKLRPWVHAAVAFGVGAVLLPLLQSFLIIGLLSGPVGLVILLLAVPGTCALFGVLGDSFLRRRSGWWLAVTGLVYVPVVIATTMSGQGMLTYDPRSFVVAGLIPAAFALFGHAGIPRIAALAVGVLAIVAMAFGGLAPIPSNESEADLPAVGFQYSFLPYGTELSGYTMLGDPFEAAPDVLLVTYLPEGTVLTEVAREPGEITIITERTTVLCGFYVFGAVRSGGALPESSCKVADGVAYRTSDGNHEVSQRVGDLTVRANGSFDVPVEQLRVALAAIHGLDEYPFASSPE